MSLRFLLNSESAVLEWNLDTVLSWAYNVCAWYKTSSLKVISQWRHCGTYSIKNLYSWDGIDISNKLWCGINTLNACRGADLDDTLREQFGCIPYQTLGKFLQVECWSAAYCAFTVEYSYVATFSRFPCRSVCPMDCSVDSGISTYLQECPWLWHRPN